MTPKLKVETLGQTAVITLANPPANTWDEESLGALPKILDDLDKNVRAVVITAEGPKFFCAGADLKMFAPGPGAKVKASFIIEPFGAAFEKLAHFPGVTICALNGMAMGGGLECALACDFRIAEKHAVLGLPETAVGLLPAGGGTQNLARLVGEPWAKRMILLNEKVSAAQAFEIGLVDAVVDAGQAKSTALAWAAKSMEQSPTAVKASKKLIQATRSPFTGTQYLEERAAFVRLFDSEDTAEGVKAFLEKRKPVWKNT